MSKTVIITGASSGIGKSLVEVYLKNGDNVVGAARSRENLELLKSEFSSLPGKLSIIAADVSKEDDCKEIIDFAVKEFGGINILINNAGISMRANFAELDLNVLRKVMDINYWGTVYCTKYAMPYLLKSKGSVVGVSSIAGYKGLPLRTGYSSSKFAMQGFLESLRIENLNTGLHVLIACPGFTASNIRNVALAKDGKPQSESPRDEEKMMQPDEVARLIKNATDKRKPTLILTTQGKLTVLLNKFFPSFVDKLVYNHLKKEKNSGL